MWVLFVVAVSAWPLLISCFRTDDGVDKDLALQDEVVAQEMTAEVMDEEAKELMAAIPASWEPYVLRDKVGMKWFPWLKTTQEIGRGAYGKVTSVTLPCNPHRHLALKTQVIQTSTLPAMEFEVKLMLTGHPRLLNVYAYNIANPEKGQPNKYYMLMPLANGILSRDQSPPRLGGDRYGALVIAHDVLYGLKFMHENNIVHRDIKSENIFYFCPAEPDKFCNAVLADFGFACKLPNEGSNLTGRPCPKLDLSGTRYYVAPEMFAMLFGTVRNLRDFEPLLKGNDVYAAGLTLQGSLGSIARSSSSPEISKMYELFARMRSKSPADRPTAAEAYEELNTLLLPIRSGVNLYDSVVDLGSNCTETLAALRAHSGQASELYGRVD